MVHATGCPFNMRLRVIAAFSRDVTLECVRIFSKVMPQPRELRPFGRAKTGPKSRGQTADRIQVVGKFVKGKIARSILTDMGNKTI